MGYSIQFNSACNSHYMYKLSFCPAYNLLPFYSDGSALCRVVTKSSVQCMEIQIWLFLLIIRNMTVNIAQHHMAIYDKSYCCAGEWCSWLVVRTTIWIIGKDQKLVNKTLITSEGRWFVKVHVPHNNNSVFRTYGLKIGKNHALSLIFILTWEVLHLVLNQRLIHFTVLLCNTVQIIVFCYSR